METFLRNLRYALRALAKSPGFAAVAIITLALGIGANTAIFSVVNSVLLQPLSYPEPNRLVELEGTSPQGNSDATSIPKFNAWRDQTQVFDSVAAYDFEGPGINLTGGDRPEQLKGIRVSKDYFRVFGAPMALGRTFTADEDRRAHGFGRQPEASPSHGGVSGNEACVGGGHARRWLVAGARAIAEQPALRRETVGPDDDRSCRNFANCGYAVGDVSACPARQPCRPYGCIAIRIT